MNLNGKTVEAKFIILTWYVQPNEIMAINKFQGQGWPFSLSAKFTHIGVPSYIKTLFSQKPLGQLNSNYIWRLLKSYTKCYGHMTKMATMPIYGKNPFKIFFSRTRRLRTLGLCM